RIMEYILANPSGGATHPGSDDEGSEDGELMRAIALSMQGVEAAVDTSNVEDETSTSEAQGENENDEQKVEESFEEKKQSQNGEDVAEAERANEESVPASTAALDRLSDAFSAGIMDAVFRIAQSSADQLCLYEGNWQVG